MTAWFKCFFTISSSSRRAQMALSLLETSSSRYWYLSFFLALHSLALWRLRSSLAFRSIFAGLRPRLPGFFTLPATIWPQITQTVIYHTYKQHTAFFIVIYLFVYCLLGFSIYCIHLQTQRTGININTLPPPVPTSYIHSSPVQSTCTILVSRIVIIRNMSIIRVYYLSMNTQVSIYPAG